MNSTNKNKLQNDSLARKLEIERERIELIKKRKRTVYEAICTLSDPVDEHEMIEYLHVLDLPAWSEVIEERFLGRICGYPVCSNEIRVNFRKKYIIHKKEGQKEFIPIDAEPNKFCSLRCMCLARSVGSQLDSGEQHLAALSLPSSARRKKEFNLPNEEAEWRKFLNEGENQKEGHLSNSKSSHCFVESELVKSLFDLKVADNDNTTDEGKSRAIGESEENSSDSEREENEFLASLKLNVIKKEGKKGKENDQIEKPALEEMEWKRGFLLTESAATNKLPIKSTEKSKILGNVVEKLHQKWTEKVSEDKKKTLKGMGKKPPKIIEPEMIRVQHRN